MPLPAADAEKVIHPVSRIPVSVRENLIIALCILGDAPFADVEVILAEWHRPIRTASLPR